MSAAIAVTAALLVTGVLVPAERAQAFTVPGQPGTPQAPTPVFTEDFSARDASAAAIDIVNYQGTPGTVYSPGVSGASSETYTADPQWQGQGNRCNGWIVNSSTPAPPGWQCAGVGITGIHQMAQYIGDYQGMSATAAARNQALTAYTADPTGAGVQMQTVAPMPATAGHFYQVSAVFGETNCAAQFTQASERFALLVDGTLNVVGSNLNPCTDPSRKQYPNGPAGPTFVSTLQSAPLKITSAGSPTIGLQLYNAQGSGSGNDVVFDLPQIFDVTPQLDKAFSPSTIASGQTSTLTFTITNTTELAAKNGWSFLDNLPDGITATGVNGTTCSGATVTAPAGSASVQVGGNLNQGQNSCTVTVQVTATIPGTYINGPGNFPDGTAGLDGLNPPADTPLTVSPPASLNLTKSSTTTAITRVGQVVTYKFAVVNRSSVTVHDLVVTDTQTAPASQANLTPILCETTTLAPQDSTTCTARYTVTQADLDHGSLNDTATASAVDPGGATVTAPPASLGIGTSRPAIAIEKTSSTTLVNAVGQSVPYAFRVTNTGNVALTGVRVTDTQTPPATQANMTPVSCPPGALQPGDTVDCTGTYTVTRSDLDHGLLRDTATAAATAPDGSTVDAPEAQLRITSDPALQIEKSSPTALVDTIGQVVPYTFRVTNIRSGTVSNVRVDDTVQYPSSPSALSAILCDDVTLASGASTTCRGTYTVTAADIANGSVDDSAVAEGTDANGLPLPPSEPSALSIPTSPSPSLSVEKSSNTAVVTRVGQDIAFQFVVRNTGNVAIGDIDVEDTPAPPADPANVTAVSCPAPTLDPGQAETCTAHYIATAADLANGSIADSAVATGRTADGTGVRSTPDDLSIPAPPTPPALTVVKSSTSTGISMLNEQIPYTFMVTNTGTVPLTDVRVVDTQQAPAVQSNLSAVTCPATTLAAGVSMTCTARYTTTQPDFDHGRVDDSAVALGTDPGSTQVQSAPSTFSVPVDPTELGLTVQKRSTTTLATQAGQQIPYEFVVTNTGTQTLSAISVTDTVAAPSVPSNLSAIVCPSGGLLPDKSVVCAATYTVTEADLNNGTVRDTASASGLSPANVPVYSAPSPLAIPTEQAPAITVTKSSTTTAATRVGEVVPYTFLVRNTGNVTLLGVAVTDTVAPPSLPSNLTPIDCPTTTLAPGAEVTCTAQYRVTQEDVISGSLSDAATAAGTPPASPATPDPTPVVSAESTVVVPILVQASVSLVKSSAAAGVTYAGQQIPYEFLVRNTGNVPLTGIAVSDIVAAPSDPAALGPVTCPATDLAPDEQTVCTATYTATQADLDSGSVNDTATAHGTPPATAPDPSPVESAPSSVSLPAVGSPALTVEKSASSDPPTAPGQQVRYAFLVTNTGNTTLSGISVTDAVDAPSDPAALTPVTCPGDTLIPGAAMDCTATYTVTQADIDHGSVGDRADAAGADPRGSVVTAPPSALLIGVDQRPAVTLVKSAALSGSSSDSLVPGETVQYTFVVTNTGNTTLTALLVDETVFTGSGPAPTVTCPPEPLLPGQQAICTSSPYTILTADAQRGTVDNTAEATLTTPDGSTIASPPSSFSVPFIPAPSLALEKSADPTTITTAGETVDYTFLVTNTGNVPLGNLAVDEVAFSGTGPTPDVACPSVTLVPGQQATCTATYQPTQPDVDAGVVVNTAQANGTTADFTHAFVSSNESSAVVTMDDIAGLTLEKTVTPATVHSAGETVVYHYLLTNEGNTTLTDPVVTETAFTGTGTLPPPVCPATIAPLTTGECTVGYTVTQADVDAGTVTNTAVAAAVTASGATVDAAPASAVLTAPHDDGLTLVKSVSRSGDTAQFAYRVSNTGNTTIHDIAIAETAFSGTGPVPSPSCPATTLAPGESVTCTAVYALTAADLAAGTLTNTATAGGTGPDGATVGSPSSTAGLAMEHASVSGSALADTGSMRPTEPALLAGALLLLGLLVLVRRRRRHA